MLTAAGLAWGLVSGAPVQVLVLVALAIYQPWIALALLGALTVFGREKTGVDEGAFLQAVAAELRGGASLRAALAEAADPVRSLRSAARGARAGQPLGQVAGLLSTGLPRYGRLTATAVRIAGRTGGRVASTFDELALLAAEDLQIEGERKAATAQARLSAWIVGGLPVAYLVFALRRGHLAVLWNTGNAGMVVLGLGGLFLVSGTVAVAALVRRAAR